MEDSVDAVVVHYNRTDLTTRCIEALSRDEGPLRTVTIIDSGSTSPVGHQQLKEWGRLLSRKNGSSPPIGFFFESLRENVGFAGANNHGLYRRLPHGAGFFLVINNDAYVEPSALSEMLGAAIKTGAAMIAPAVYRANEPGRIDRFGLTLTKTGSGYDRRHDADGPLLCPSGCAALYRRDLVMDLMGDPEGFFDRRFEAYAEDLDVGLRARTRGYSVAFASAATILHEGGATFGPSSPRSYFLRHRNTIWTIAKNFSLDLIVTFSFSLLIGQVAGLANAVRRGRFKAVVKGKFEGVRAWSSFRRENGYSPRFSDPNLLDQRLWIKR